MKKGRHRRFEEARKLKQSGPDFLFTDTGRSETDTDTDDEVADDDVDYAALAAKYDVADDADDDE